MRLIKSYKKYLLSIIATFAVFFTSILPSFASTFGGASWVYNSTRDYDTLQYDYTTATKVNWTYWATYSDETNNKPSVLSGTFGSTDGIANFHCNGAYHFDFLDANGNVIGGYDQTDDYQYISNQDCTQGGILTVPNPLINPPPPDTTDTTPPGEVTDVQWSATDTTITLTWTNPTDSDFSTAEVFVDGNLYGSTASGTITISGLTPDTGYNIQIKTKDTTGNESGGITSDTIWTLPKPPTNTNTSSKTDSNTINWDIPTDPNYDHTDVYRDGQKIGTSKTGSYTDTGLQPQTDYTYKVINVGKDGNESQPSEVSATTECQACQVYECPEWSDYMGKVDQIINKIPPAPDWNQMTDAFNQNVVPGLIQDIGNVIGEAPAPPPAPSEPPQPTTDSNVDDGGLSQSEPTMQTPTGLDSSGFSKDDVESQAPVIQENPDPTGGFKDDLTKNPVDALPDLPDPSSFPKPGMSAGDYLHTPQPGNATPPPAPTVDPQGTTTGPTPASTTDTPPSPGSTTTEAPTPSTPSTGSDSNYGYYKTSP